MEEKKAKGKGGRKKKDMPPPTYRHLVSINGAPHVDLFSLPDDLRQKVVQKLCDNFMLGFGMVPVDEETQKRMEAERGMVSISNN